ncbi:MAG: hypothetical protein EBZ47_02325 [Chlamydiae bacterium]|nr:hypothetical protein [Chlamydiota bacterium]
MSNINSGLDDLLAASSKGVYYDKFFENQQTLNQENTLSVDNVNSIIQQVSQSFGASPDFKS